MSTLTSLRIKAVCSCGKKYFVQTKIAGKKVKCKCGKTFTVSSPGEPVPLQEKKKAVSAPQKCLACGAKSDTEKPLCHACEHRPRVSPMKADSNSLSSALTIAVVCGVTAIVAIVIQSKLKSPSAHLFFVALGGLCAISIITARCLRCSASIVRDLTIAALLSYACVFFFRCLSVLFSVRSSESFENLALAAIISPLIVGAISYLDRIVLELEGSDSSSLGTLWHDPKIKIAAGLGIITVLVAGMHQIELTGPEFLSFYFALGVGFCIAFLIARFTGCSATVFIILLLAFEAIGLMRLGYGLTQGMHKFETLGQMMLLGPFSFLMVSAVGQGGSSGSGLGGGCSSGSSCGGGGGGGCGGGGCGGCGG